MENFRQEIKNVSGESDEYKKKYVNQQQLYEDAKSSNENLLKNLNAKQMEFKMKQGEIQNLKIEKKVDTVEINNLGTALNEARVLLKRNKEEHAINILQLERNVKKMKTRSAQLIKSFKETKRSDEMDIYNLNRNANEAKSSFEDIPRIINEQNETIGISFRKLRRVAKQLNTEKSDIQKEGEERMKEKMKEISVQGNKISELVENISENEKKIESMQRDLDEVKVSCKMLKEEKALCTKMYEDAENEGITLALDVKTLSQNVENAKKELASKELKIKCLEEKIEADEGFISKLKTEIKTVNDLLEEISNEADAGRELSAKKKIVHWKKKLKL